MSAMSCLTVIASISASGNAPDRAFSMKSSALFWFHSAKILDKVFCTDRSLNLINSSAISFSNVIVMSIPLTILSDLKFEKALSLLIFLFLKRY